MIAAIIQARMGSTRLPGKVLMNLAGKPVLWHIVTRLQLAQRLDCISIATTTDEADDRILEICRSGKIPVCRGSRDDVLSRYYTCAKQLGMQAGRADYVVRITADCPFVDPSTVDILIDHALRGRYDYVSNVDPPTFPDGFDVEIFSFDALEKAFREARRDSDREHVTPFIRNTGGFSKFNHVHTPDLSSVRLTLDTPEDYRLISNIYEALYRDGGIISLDDILKFLESRSDIRGINARYTRNEGYAKSLSEDREI